MRIRRKTALILLLILLSPALAGCGGQKPAEAPAETPLPTAPPVHTPGIAAQGGLADAARALLAPYQTEIAVAAEKSPGLLTYLIPGDLIGQMARDAQETGAQPEEGRYRFTWRQSGDHTYTASALQIRQIEAAAETTPDPRAAQEPVMDNQLMGDFSATGGGVFDRSRAYDVSETLGDGKAEITDTLNGKITGHELFSFTVQNGVLYFVDATLDQAVDMDGLVATDRYLVAAGWLKPDGMEIFEYTVPSRDQIPEASPQALAQLPAGSSLSHLIVQGENVQAVP